MAVEVTDYCSKHTNGIPRSMQDVWQWTVKSFKDADKMSSPLQVRLGLSHVQRGERRAHMANAR